MTHFSRVSRDWYLSVGNDFSRHFPWVEAGTVCSHYVKYLQGSIDSQLDAISLSGSKQGQFKERKTSLTRSQTDSNIMYTIEDVPEAPGSFCYITRDGDIDMQVVLKVKFKYNLIINFGIMNA